jgi:hypothetical protein
LAGSRRDNGNRTVPVNLNQSMCNDTLPEIAIYDFAFFIARGITPAGILATEHI